MLNEVGNLVLSYAQSHQQLAAGLILGALLTHPATLAVGLFNLLMKIPYVGPYVAKNPDKARAFADEFDKAIDDCITKYAAQPQVPEQPSALPPAK